MFVTPVMLLGNCKKYIKGVSMIQQMKYEKIPLLFTADLKLLLLKTKFIGNIPYILGPSKHGI